MNPRWSGGFTLVEVLVALGIVATAMMTGLKATAALTNGAERQAETLLGQMCAEAEFVKFRLSRELPGIGNTHVSCKQGGRTFDVTVSVITTPNSNFRRIHVAVRSGEANVLRMSTVIGLY